MKRPENVLEKFNKYTPLIDERIKKILGGQEKYLMYEMMSYFFGYKDENLNHITDLYGGKRFRPGITLLLAEHYGVKEKAVELATAIELFHNFTLIHDDIEDNDPTRRGRPTVWKLWGVAHGINTGDAQLILAQKEVLAGIITHDLDLGLADFLNESFGKVIEGQFLDFRLAETSINSPVVSEKYYLEMIGKKSAYLVGASAKIAGMIANKNKEEVNSLWDYGFNLGLAYQISDDIVSIWSSKEETGKEECADIREKKKTLPILYLYNKANKGERERIEVLYQKKSQLAPEEIVEIRNLLDKYDVKRYALSMLTETISLVDDAIKKTTLSDAAKMTLLEINEVIFPALQKEVKC